MCCEMFLFLFPEKKKSHKKHVLIIFTSNLHSYLTLFILQVMRTHTKWWIMHVLFRVPPPPSPPLPSLKPIYSLSTRSPYRSHTDCNPFSRWICGGPTDDGGVGVWERCHSVGAELELRFKCVCVCVRERVKEEEKGGGVGGLWRDCLVYTVVANYTWITQFTRNQNHSGPRAATATGGEAASLVLVMLRFLVFLLRHHPHQGLRKETRRNDGSD